MHEKKFLHPQQELLCARDSFISALSKFHRAHEGRQDRVKENLNFSGEILPG